MIAALIKIGILIGGLMTAAAYFVLLERRLHVFQPTPTVNSRITDFPFTAATSPK